MCFSIQMEEVAYFSCALFCLLNVHLGQGKDVSAAAAEGESGICQCALLWLWPLKEKSSSRTFVLGNHSCVDLNITS